MYLLQYNTCEATLHNNVNIVVVPRHGSSSDQEVANEGSLIDDFPGFQTSPGVLLRAADKKIEYNSDAMYVIYWKLPR